MRTLLQPVSRGVCHVVSAAALSMPAVAETLPFPEGSHGDGTLRLSFEIPFRAPVSWRYRESGGLTILVTTGVDELRRSSIAPTAFDQVAALRIGPREGQESWVEIEPIVPGARLDAIVLDERVFVDLFPAAFAMREIVARGQPDPVSPPVPPLEIVAAPEPVGSPDSLLFEEGLLHRRTLAHDIANHRFSLLLERHPSSIYATAAMVQIALVFDDLRDSKKAGLALERALGRSVYGSADPLARPDLLWASSLAHAGADRSYRAYTRAKELLERFPAHGAFLEAGAAMAEAALALNRYPDAREAIEVGLEGAADPAHALRLRRVGARIEKEARRFEAAVVHLDAALGLRDAPRLELLLDRADLRFRAGDMKGARADYRLVLEEGAKRGDGEWARFQVANTLLRSGELEGAAAAYGEFAEEHPDARWRQRAEWRKEISLWAFSQAREVERLTGSAPKLASGRSP